MLVDRNDLMTTASFEPVSPIVLVVQEILQRAEQKCAEPAFLLICATQRIFFKQMGKKTLDKILCFGRRMTPKSQKGIKGWPIRFTEIGERFSCCFRWIGLSSAQDQSPMRRLKRRSALLQCSRYRFHNFVISLSNASVVLRTRFTREEKLWSKISAGRKRGKNSRIPHEFAKM